MGNWEKFVFGRIILFFGCIREQLLPYGRIFTPGFQTNLYLKFVLKIQSTSVSTFRFSLQNISKNTHRGRSKTTFTAMGGEVIKCQRY